MKIASKYNWLEGIEGAPRLIKEAVKLGKLNTTEFAGFKSNPEIMFLAKEADVSDIYKSDEIAWCALAMTVLLLRAGKEVPFKKYERLRAASFINYGVPVKEPMLGDILVFTRPRGAHVGIYIGEDDIRYYVAGGNQSNQYSVVPILKSRLTAARRPVYKIAQPASVKKIFITDDGALSTNEA